MCSESSSVIALVLAAGHSRRFGDDKRVARLATGETLLAATIERVRPHVAELVVMLRHDDDAQALGLSDSVPIMHAPVAPIGMGVSLSTAVQHVSRAACPHTALAVVLGDMAFVSPDTLEGLISRVHSDAIVRPVCDGVAGHPVLFGRRFWPELAALEGDEGARSLLHRHRQHVADLEVNDPGVLLDIDTPEDLSSPVSHI